MTRADGRKYNELRPVEITTGFIKFAVIAEHYLGRAGLVVLALTVILACLKTSIGLVTSCAETFTAMFPNGPKYGFWAICFSTFTCSCRSINSYTVSHTFLSFIFLYLFMSPLVPDCFLPDIRWTRQAVD